ncbi:MAG: M48 family metalloprotease, partial [Actinomycetota bacterium]
AEAPDLYATVRNLAQAANLPMPKVYTIPSDQPNAFATGRNPNHAAVAVTQGILKVLTRDELEGVLAHELAHVGNRDILIASVAATVAGAISAIASMARWGAIFGGRDDDEGPGYLGVVVTGIFASVAALIIQMAISRSREFQADRRGAEISGRPLSLASALGKIEAHARQIPMPVNPSAAPMFIVNPLRGGAFGSFLLRAFSTHPPTEERIRRLEQIAMGR